MKKDQGVWSNGDVVGKAQGGVRHGEGVGQGSEEMMEWNVRRLWWNTIRNWMMKDQREWSNGPNWVRVW